jgi:hypothetical protein
MIALEGELGSVAPRAIEWGLWITPPAATTALLPLSGETGSVSKECSPVHPEATMAASRA